MDSLNDRGYILHFCRLHPAGEPPSPRVAHAAAAVGTMVVFQVLGTWDLQIPFPRQLFSVVIYKMVTQGGIGLAGHSTDDLYVLDLTNDKFKWHRLGLLKTPCFFLPCAFLLILFVGLRSDIFFLWHLLQGCCSRGRAWSLLWSLHGFGSSHCFCCRLFVDKFLMLILFLRSCYLRCEMR
jgi:hypothetical protein